MTKKISARRLKEITRELKHIKGVKFDYRERKSFENHPLNPERGMESNLIQRR